MHYRTYSKCVTSQTSSHHISISNPQHQSKSVIHSLLITKTVPLRHSAHGQPKRNLSHCNAPPEIRDQAGATRHFRTSRLQPGSRAPRNQCRPLRTHPLHTPRRISPPPRSPLPLTHAKCTSLRESADGRLQPTEVRNQCHIHLESRDIVADDRLQPTPEEARRSISSARRRYRQPCLSRYTSDESRQTATQYRSTEEINAGFHVWCVKRKLSESRELLQASMRSVFSQS